MPANPNPIFVLTPNVGHARVAGLNTASDGSTPGGETAIATLFTAGANGSLLQRLRWLNSQVTAAASGAKVIRFWLTDTGGINPRLFYEVALATATRSTTAIGAQGSFALPGNGLFLAYGQLVKVAQSVYAGVQDQMDYTAEGGDY
jgi:hypothetical protein